MGRKRTAVPVLAAASAVGLLLGLSAPMAGATTGHDQAGRSDRAAQMSRSTDHDEHPATDGDRAAPERNAGLRAGRDAGLRAERNDGGNRPPGNNGTIKIDDAQYDGRGTTSHVRCTFFVNFFGYDAGTQQATMVFEPWAPTRGGTIVTKTTSWTTAERTGGNQLDARYGPVDLTAAFAGVAPHPKQGWHVKLTVHVTGSQGSDAKHKVFWVEPCQQAAGATAKPEAMSAPAQEGTSSGRVSTALVAGSPAPAGAAGGPDAEVLGMEVTAPSTGAGEPTVVLGETVTRGSAGPGSVRAATAGRPAGMAFTGARIATMLLVAGLLLLGGASVVRMSRRKAAKQP